MAATGMAESKHALVGTWKLVSAKNTTEKGEVKDQMGPNPIGVLTYTADGRVSVFMADSGRKPFSKYPATAEEKIAALDTFFAYAGSYSLAGDKLTHHIEICLVQAFVNTDQVRSVKLEGDRLTLRGGFLVGGVMYQPNNEVVWERMKPKTADQ